MTYHKKALRYSKWGTGEPNNPGHKDACLSLVKEHGYEWNDEPCERRYCFVCEDRRFPV